MRISRFWYTTLLLLTNVSCVGTTDDGSEFDDTLGLGGFGGEPGDDSRQVEQKIFGLKSCKKAKISLTNNGEVPQKVIGFGYWDDTWGGWRYEDVSNYDLLPGWTATWTENLGDTKNHRITKWEVYMERNYFLGSSYSRGATVVEGYNRKCVSNAGTQYKLSVSPR